MEAVYSWFTAHPHLAALAVFCIALAESLAVIGMIIPGVAMMFAAGALIGAGALAFTPICFSAIAGAIAGDSVSFWLGRHFRDHLPSIWPFHSYGQMIGRGTTFFHRYGGLSILFGRFVGPVRAVIPLIAGMLAMPTNRFLAFNILSALLWGPAYLLPGMAFGASLELASKVTGRLVTILVLLLASLWFTAWSSKRLYAFLQPRAHRFILFTFDLSKRHPLLGRLTVPLIDPNQRDYAGLSTWALLLLGSSVILSRAATFDLLHLSLEAMRTPWFDYVLTVIGVLGHHRTFGVLTVMVAFWLWRQQRNVALTHWLAAMGFVMALEATTRWILGIGSPLDGPTLRAGVCYGFVAVLLADEIRAQKRHWLVYTSMSLIGVLVGFSRLYLAAGTLSSVVPAWLTALTWVLLVGVAYRRHRDAGRQASSLVWLTATTLVIVLAAEARSHSLADFETHPSSEILARAEWMEFGWLTLPDQRVQMFGSPNQPLAVQWAASLPDLRKALLAAGWQEAAPLTWSTALIWLNPAATVGQLPVVPHFNQTGIDLVRVVKQPEEGDWLLLRFWPSFRQLKDTAEPIWLGSAARLKEKPLVGLARYVEETPVDEETLARLLHEITRSNTSCRLTERNKQGRVVWLIGSPREGIVLSGHRASPSPSFPVAGN